MTHDFSGRHALVTGAGGGIGLAIATALAATGCGVIGFDLKPAPDELGRTGGDVRYVQGDIRDQAALERAFALCDEPGIDFIVNAAGVAMMGRDGSVVDVDMDVWRTTMDVNLNGAVLIARLGVPRLLKKERSSIVHIASVVGLRSMDNALAEQGADAYQVSKAALVSLSRGLALAYGRNGLRSNTVCPGAIWTPMTNHIYQNPARITAMEERTPLKRPGHPENVADAALFLLSDAASFITGIDLVVDGGLMAKVA